MMLSSRLLDCQLLSKVRLLPRLETRMPQSRTIFGQKPPPKAEITIDHRVPSTCSKSPYVYPDPRPCFDISSVLVERGNECHEKLIRSFLYSHYWPREPSTVSLYMPICSPYLAILTDKYATTGDRWLAFEVQPRTKERRPVGVLVADKTFPWVADELEDWANRCCLVPERHSMYFTAHCLRSPNLFQKYHVPYIYNIDCLATAADVAGQGVAALLLQSAVMRAMELRHPLIQIVSKSAYTHSVCTKAGMKKEWEMNYSDFVDMKGQSVFYPRRPHLTVAIYIMPFSQKHGSIPDDLDTPSLYAVFKKQVLKKKTPKFPPKKRCDP